MKLSLYIDNVDDKKYAEKLVMEKVDEKLSKMINLTETKLSKQLSSSSENLTKLIDLKAESLENKYIMEERINQKIDNLIQSRESEAKALDEKIRNLESRYTELLKSIGSLESRSRNEIQGSITSLIQTSKSETNYLTHKLETLQSKLNNLENNMNLIDSGIKQKFDNYNGTLSREFEMRLINLDKIKIHKGMWNFNNLNINRYPDHQVSANFPVLFKSNPTVFYTIKTYHISNNRGGLWSIVWIFLFLNFIKHSNYLQTLLNKTIFKSVY
jgi:hypothetical protein